MGIETIGVIFALLIGYLVWRAFHRRDPQDDLPHNPGTPKTPLNKR